MANLKSLPDSNFKTTDIDLSEGSLSDILMKLRGSLELFYEIGFTSSYKLRDLDVLIDNELVRLHFSARYEERLDFLAKRYAVSVKAIEGILGRRSNLIDTLNKRGNFTLPLFDTLERL